MTIFTLEQILEFHLAIRAKINMKKYLYLSILPLVLVLNSCVKVDPPVAAQEPVISFYLGIDPWTHQPTFIYSDTTVTGTKQRYLRANFAASGTIKKITVKNNDVVLYEKTIENSTVYNEEYQIELKPVLVPTTYNLYFKVEDYNGKTAEKALKVNFL